jgi:hypothetical protein
LMNPRPAHRRRHDGWTPERQALFLAALESTGCVSTAAAAVGKSRAGAYRFRDRADGARFGRLWEIALRSRSEGLLLGRVAKLTLAADLKRTPGPAAAGFRSGERDEGDSSLRNSQQRQFRQACRLSPEREAELRRIMAAGCRAPSQGRR